MGFLSTIIGAFDPISRITESIAKAKIAAANAQTDREKIAAEERVATLEARRAVMIAEAGSRINSIMRALLALAVVIIVWKLLVWDKALGQWTGGYTDKLSDLDQHLIIAVIGFYFLYELGARWKR